jgi:hypothetical protein
MRQKKGGMIQVRRISIYQYFYIEEQFLMSREKMEKSYKKQNVMMKQNYFL